MQALKMFYISSYTDFSYPFRLQSLKNIQQNAVFFFQNTFSHKCNLPFLKFALKVQSFLASRQMLLKEFSFFSSTNISSILSFEGCIFCFYFCSFMKKNYEPPKYELNINLLQLLQKMKANAYNSQELKHEIHKMVSARQNIEKGTDISGSMVNLNKSMNKINPLMKKQQTYIKNFFSQQESTDTQSKDSQNRRYANRIFQIALNQITQLMNVGEEYFTLDFKNSWDKIKTNLQKELAALRQGIEQKNIIQFLFRVINVKDYITSHLMKSFLYRKCLLWKDINIINEGYVHSDKKATTKSIQDYLSNRGYAPTKPIFEWSGFKVKGPWTMNKLQQEQFSLPTSLKIINHEIEEVFGVLRNYANLTVEQRNHEDIKRNTPIVKSLRQEIQEFQNSYLQLQKKYRDAVLKDEKMDIIEMKEKLQQCEQTLQAKDSELRKLNFQFRDSANQINSLRDKVKQLQSDLSRVTNSQLKKLKQLETVQTNLSEQFSRIHKNISNFGAMFEFESDGKKSLAQQIVNQNTRIEGLAVLLGRQKNMNAELKREIVRLNEIILQMGAHFRQDDS